MQKALDNKVEKQEGARLITASESNKLNTLLGITAISSDFSLNNGVLGLNYEKHQEIQDSLVKLDKKVSDIEETILWDNL